MMCRVVGEPGNVGDGVKVGSGVGVAVVVAVGTSVAVDVFGSVGAGELVATTCTPVTCTLASCASTVDAQPLTSNANKTNTKKGKYTFVIIGVILTDRTAIG